MKRNRLSICLCLLMALVLSVPVSADNINVIPRPASVVQGEGYFLLTPETRYAVEGKDARETALMFVEKVRQLTGFTLQKGKASKGKAIVFKIDKSVKGSEAYRLEVTPHVVKASASTTAGLYYAMQTLVQLLPPPAERSSAQLSSMKWTIPVVKIADSPRFAYRGVMLDPCRHFIPVEDVKAQIEHLAAYKINRVHWHLTDDQGWRIEIKKYPELLTKAAVRTEGEGTQHSGYYTQEEVKDVVAFAARHHVEIIPEFEMPGHELAAIAAYPWLSCRNVTITPRIIWGVEDIVICPGRETTFKFIKDVIDEMLPLFPAPLFHIGGDESPREEWAHCDSCQARMKQLGYKKEAQLQSYVVGRVGKYLHSKGKRLVGWDEILEGGDLDTSAIVMSWRGESGGIAAANMGHHVLMTPSSHGMYFDQYQSDHMTEPVAIGGMSTLKKVYAYDPVPESLAKEGRGHYVMGVQANCWSEYMHNPKTLEYRLFPRALALSEIAWTPVKEKDYDDFIRRLDNDAALRLRAEHINFHIPAVEQPGGSLSDVAFLDGMNLSLTSVRPLPIVYTVDGTEPTASSPRYSSPIHLDATTSVRTAVLLPCGLLGPERTIRCVKQSLSPAVPETETMKSGLMLSVYRGVYRNPEALKGQPSEVKEVTGITELRRQASVPSNVRNVDDYATVAEGYVRIPEDGVYEFSTNNSQLWIDGQLIVDNSRYAVPRYSPHNGSRALSAGLHRIKVIFLGGIFGGWPTYWDDASVNMRRMNGDNRGEWSKWNQEMFMRDNK